MTENSSVLRDPRRELFCQKIVSGSSREEAYQQAGYKGKNAKLSSWRVAALPEIKARIKVLMERSAQRAELSRKDILERILEDWETSRKLGQMASALKAGELIGREVHRMFTERKEVGGPGDFDGKSEDELKAIIQEQLDDLGWEKPPSGTIN